MEPLQPELDPVTSEIHYWNLKLESLFLYCHFLPILTWGTEHSLPSATTVPHYIYICIFIHKKKFTTSSGLKYSQMYAQTLDRAWLIFCFLNLEFKWWKDKPGTNVPTKQIEQQWEHIQPLKSCFCITPSMLEIALGVCKLSLKIQTITLIISFQQGGHEAKSRHSGQHGRGNVNTSQVV